MGDEKVLTNLEELVGPSNDSIPTVNYVQSKIAEFSNLFNSSYRLSILNCDRAERENFIYLLTSLRKSMKWALEEMGKSLSKKKYEFNCSLCNEEITVNPNEDIWSKLQDHAHFEELYYQFINNELDLGSITEQVTTNIPVTSESDNTDSHIATSAGDSNTDSGIEQQEIEPSTSTTPCVIISSPQVNHTSAKDDSSSEENVNSFRFNFNVSYDKTIEAKIYPATMMLGIRKYDNVKDFTIMRAGPSKAVCLICNCEMNGMRICKRMLVGHAMGQRHLKAAVHPPTLQLLQIFHDFWLKQEPIVQAQQVYFSPNNKNTMQCALCGWLYFTTDIISHILSDNHKKKVLDMYEKRAKLYFLVNMQVQLYGISKAEAEAREGENRREETKDNEQDAGNNSDSDSADEPKKVTNRPPKGEHNIIRSVEKPESTNILDLLPNRMKSFAKLFKPISASDGIMCFKCERIIAGNSITALKHHLILFHAADKKLQRERYKYFCEICNVRVMNEAGWLKHDFTGGKHKSMAVKRKEKATEYECTTCKTVLFGDEVSLVRHLSIPKSKSEAKKKDTKLPEEVKNLFHSKEFILAEAAVLAGNAEDVLTNSLTKDCCSRIETLLRESFADPKVYPFGSRISGIGNKASDLDVFVDIGEAYYGEENQNAMDQVNIIRKAYKTLAKYKKEFNKLVQVLTARTPILKLHHIPTNLDCDLSFKHGLSVENTKFLRYCLELQPVCQQLILIIKKWAGFIIFESITTYAFAIMCIFYLQVNGYLFSVKEILKMHSVGPKTINGWTTINYVLSVNEAKQRTKSYDKSVLDLLKEFFNYYGTFDFNSYVICPLLGRVVQRSLFSEGDPQNLPVEMKAYIDQLETENAELFRSNSYMCVQDPFDLSHNLTKAVQQGTLKKFQNMCKLSLSHIEALK